ncbi:hypothetical protein vseg_007693 [Gypsophila vaccaria]
MDFDPRITSDGKGYGAEYGVHCNFHYGNVHDFFDEDVKNEDACVQALRHLITKADTDIADLEDELAILRCQRKWAEADELRNPFEVCCAAFKHKINSLTSVVQKMRNGVDTSDFFRPTERIHDIIDALISSNFTEPNKQTQEGNLHNEIHVFGSLDINIDEDKDATSSESSSESKKQTPFTERPAKVTQTVSEESFSDAAKYLTKDLTEVRSIGLSIFEVSESIQSAEHASEEKRGLPTSIETIDSQSPLQASNDEGNSKPTALHCGEIESCMGGSKTGESMSLMLPANTEVKIKAEQDGHDTNIQHDSAYSLSRVQNPGEKDAYESHLEALEAEALCASDRQIACSRKKSSLSPIAQMKTSDDARSSSPSQTLKPQKTITKRKSSSVEKSFGGSDSPSSEIKRGLRFLPETDRQTKLGTEGNPDIGNPYQISQTKKIHPKLELGTEGNPDFGNPYQISQTKKIHPKLEFPEGSLVATGSVAPKLSGRNIGRLKSLSPEEVKDSSDRNIRRVNLLGGVEVKDSAVTLADTVTPGSSRPAVKKPKPKPELPFADVQSLRRRVSEEPDFLRKQNAMFLRETAKLCELRGRSKDTKQTLIEKLSKFLDTQ